MDCDYGSLHPTIPQYCIMLLVRRACDCLQFLKELKTIFTVRSLDDVKKLLEHSPDLLSPLFETNKSIPLFQTPYCPIYFGIWVAHSNFETFYSHVL